MAAKLIAVTGRGEGDGVDCGAGSLTGERLEPMYRRTPESPCRQPELRTPKPCRGSVSLEAPGPGWDWGLGCRGQKPYQ